MKKIALCLFAALSFNAYADMPNVDYGKVKLESCELSQKIVSKAGELTKPITQETFQGMADRTTDLIYHTMGGYYNDVADMMVSENIDVLSSEQISETKAVEEHVTQSVLDGFEYFIINRHCMGLPQ